MRKNFLIFIYIFLIIICNLTTISFCDDIGDDEIIDVNAEITSSSPKENNIKIPETNSRACVVIDRNTNTILYGKNENTKRKMASTTNVMVTQTTLFKCRFFFTNFICNTLFFS